MFGTRLTQPLDTPATPPQQETALTALHRGLGAKIVPFAGYAMPVQFPSGIIAEHLHTRAAAGLFDVGHMGQMKLFGKSADAALQAVITADLSTLKLGRTRYSLLLNEAGGIIDDLMVTRYHDHLYLVINASRKAVDAPIITSAVAAAGGRAEMMEDSALMALQGPLAGAVLALFAPESEALAFMESAVLPVAGIEAIVTRCGYTGEDGFELSVPNVHAANLAEQLLSHDDVKPIGLGARDSLRLEAGLCLYGHDITEDITPVQADLTFAIGKRRKIERDFLGAQRIMRQLEEGVDKVRIGLLLEGRRPAREGAPIVAKDGAVIGHVTSGGFSPTLERPIAMGYVAREYSLDGMALGIDVRGKVLEAQVTPMPFVPQRYRRRSVG